MDKITNFDSKTQIINKFVRKCPDSIEYIERMEKELNLIVEKKFANYILQVCEILELVGDVPHIIRGSSGSSLVCWLLGITSIDPVLNSICFSRFLNEFRNSMPDIDMDFPHNQRNKIFKKIFDRWPNVVRISNYVCYKDKGAIRKALKDMGIVGKIDKSKCNLNYFKDGEKKKELAKRVKEIKNTFKNYSLHCGGIIFFSNVADMEKYNIVDRQIMLNKVDVEVEGFFKIDILANRGLTQLVKIDSKPLDTYDFKDEKTIQLLSSGNNIGLTFAESPGMRKIFSTFKPKTPLDVAKCLALIRPGASVNTNEKTTNKKMTYTNANVEESDVMSDLIDELNIDDDIIFDDDAIKYIQKILNCDESKADNIRRLYSKGDRLKIGQFELELMESKPELDVDEITKISNKLINLRKYSFCKSHALSYAYLVWALAWQKANNPKQFWKSTTINCHSMYRKWVHVREAICSGVKITCDDTLDDLTHFYKYGFWLGKNFLDSLNMYVNVLEENGKKITCEFRGLIATSKYYKKYNTKTKSYDLVTFVTIGYENKTYIDLVVKGWIKTKHQNICSGKGMVKINCDYACIYVEKLDKK